MIKIDGNHLTIEEVISVSLHYEEVELTREARKQIITSHEHVAEIVNAGKPVYGINTGFGIFSNKNISIEDIAKLNRNLILSHAVATGPDLPKEVVRAAMLIRANTLASGYSGIQIDLVENLIEMLNKDLIPCVPSQGSMGSSGDLAPLSHLALVLTTDDRDKDSDSGLAVYQGRKMTGKAAMKAAGIDRLILGPKESLAITNGATFSAALAALSIHHSRNLLEAAELALAMSLEALLGVSTAFDERIHQVRKQSGQIEVAKRVRNLTKGSTLLNAGGRVQDAYSLRCAPQVQGPARDTLNFVENIISNEINAVTDNPLIFGPDEALSGGNFHGEPVGMVMDFLKIAISEVAAISERRIFQLTDSNMNAGLPPMLVHNEDAAGLNSGLMMPQYTAASLVLENQHLAGPDSVNSLPTSGGKEDHNANSMTAARNAYQVVKNATHVIGVELYSASRALDIRKNQISDAKIGDGVYLAFKQIREQIPYQAGDAWWAPEIEEVKNMIWDGKFKL